MSYLSVYEATGNFGQCEPVFLLTSLFFIIKSLVDILNGQY